MSGTSNFFGPSYFEMTVAYYKNIFPYILFVAVHTIYCSPIDSLSLVNNIHSDLKFKNSIRKFLIHYLFSILDRYLEYVRFIFTNSNSNPRKHF